MAEWGKRTNSGKGLFKNGYLGVALCQNTLEAWVNLILLCTQSFKLCSHKQIFVFIQRALWLTSPADESVSKVACRDTWLVAEWRQQCLPARGVPTLPDNRLSDQSVPWSRGSRWWWWW